MVGVGLGFLLLSYLSKVTSQACETCGSPDPPDVAHTLLQVRAVEEKINVNVSASWFDHHTAGDEMLPFSVCSLTMNPNNHGTTNDRVSVIWSCSEESDGPLDPTNVTLGKTHYEWKLPFSSRRMCSDPKIAVTIDGGDAARIDYATVGQYKYNQYNEFRETMWESSFGVLGGGAWALSTQPSDGNTWRSPRPADSCWQFEVSPKRVTRCSV